MWIKLIVEDDKKEKEVRVNFDLVEFYREGKKGTVIQFKKGHSIRVRQLASELDRILGDVKIGEIAALADVE